MEIRVNTGNTQAVITITEAATIDEALYTIVGALLLEGYPPALIAAGLQQVTKHFAESTNIN